jgi:hypothetical protein
VIFEIKTAFVASNLLAQFSRQIVVQIIGLASPHVLGNLAIEWVLQLVVPWIFSRFSL